MHPPLRAQSGDRYPLDRPPRLLSYSPALDGLRGVSILVVMGFHFGLPGFRGGFLGVDVFFALSGFLITVLLFDEYERTAKIDMWAFYVRRVRRLIPALTTLLLAIALISLLPSVTEKAPMRLGILLAGSYVTNIAESLFGFSAPALNHTWSLSLEEQFYLLWPLILALTLRLRVSPAVRLWALGLTIAFVAWHRATLWIDGAAWTRVYVAPDTRCDSILLGCFAGCAYATSADQLASRSSWMAVASGVSALILAALVAYPGSWRSPLFPLGLFTLVGVCSSILVLAVVTASSPLLLKLLTQPFLLRTGRISYALYLWHYPIFIGLSGKTRFAGVTFLLSFAAAELSWRLVEVRFLRGKRVPTRAVEA